MSLWVYGTDRRTGEQTDGRTGKTYNAPYDGRIQYSTVTAYKICQAVTL